MIYQSKEVVALVNASKPKSVTMFIDACYSGKTSVVEALFKCQIISLEGGYQCVPIQLHTDHVIL